MNQYATHEIESILVQPGYNIRSEAELKANAKDVAKNMEASGDVAEMFPICYVEIDGQKFTRNHATLEAAKARGWKEVVAFRSPFVPNSLEDYLHLITSNNGGHPISPLAQGQLFKKLVDGIPDIEATESARQVAAVGDVVETIWILPPSSLKEVGDSAKPAVSREWVRQCIVLAESPEAIQELMNADKVSAGVVTSAKSLAKGDEKKHIAIVKAAIKAAEKDGKEKATDKHFEAIKSDFKPVAKLVADGGVKDEEKKDDPKAEKEGNGALYSPVDTSKSPGNGNASEDESDEDDDQPELLGKGDDSAPKTPHYHAKWDALLEPYIAGEEREAIIADLEAAMIEEVL